jgi:hypothetical protein
MNLGHLGAAILVAGLTMGAPGAFAFQLVPSDTNTDGSTKFTDPDQKTENLANSYQSGNGTGTLKFGNATLQFGMSGANSGSSPAMQERFLQSPAARTVPSQGGW